MSEDSLKDFLEAPGEESGEYRDSDDFYQLYLQELSEVKPCTPEEETALLKDLLAGRKEAAGRLVEGKLKAAVQLAEEYRDRGLSMNDLVQEANVALLLAAQEYEGGDFDHLFKARIREALEEAISAQDTEHKIEEEMAARVNVLKDISAAMAEELGREATVEELAERMKMTEEEIKDIMKLTLDAMSVGGGSL